MAVKQEYIDIIVNIPGFSVVMVGTGGGCRPRHDSSERCVRDMPYGPWKYSRLVFWQARVDCPKCGVVTEHLDWVGRRGGDSKRPARGGGPFLPGGGGLK